MARPPSWPPRDLVDAVEVWLVRDALHYGLVLPRDERTCVEYGYGDWDWYALCHDSCYDVFDTMLWPTQGALGRRDATRGPDEPVTRAFRSGTLHPLWVERSRAAALVSELDARFAAARASAHWNERHGLTFVHHERGFWAFHYCADATAAWLEALGARWASPVRGGLRLRPPR